MNLLLVAKQLFNWGFMTTYTPTCFIVIHSSPEFKWFLQVWKGPYPVLRGVWPERQGAARKEMNAPNLFNFVFFWRGWTVCQCFVFFMFTLVYGNDPIWLIFCKLGWFNHQPTRKLGKDSAGRFGNRCRSGMMPLAFWGEENVKKPMRHPCDEKSWITYIDPTKITKI